MNELVVLDEEKGIPVMDSRLLAETLGIEPRSLRQLMKEHETEIGETTFQMSIPTGLGGRTEEYALLNERQAMRILMFTRNSEESIQAKLALVDAFFTMRSNIQITQNAAQALINRKNEERLARIEEQNKVVSLELAEHQDCLQSHIEQILVEECRGTEIAEDLRKARLVLEDTTKTFWECGASDQEHWEVTRAVLRYLIAHDSQLAAYLKKMGMKV